MHVINISPHVANSYSLHAQEVIRRPLDIVKTSVMLAIGAPSE